MLAGSKFTSKTKTFSFIFIQVFFFKYDYPLVENNEKRFLNSGGFMGYASDIYEMISSQEKIEDDDDDQLFYTKIFLDETTRVKFLNKKKNKTKMFIF